MPTIKKFDQACDFLSDAGFCLRYGPNESLPIPSLYGAVTGKVKAPNKDQLKLAIELTNQLLEKHQGIEVNVIADRLCLVHRDLMPALYTLVRKQELPSLSVHAKKVLSLIEEKGEITAGDVRELLGIPAAKTGEDPAYMILSELQKHLLVDRGPFEISNSGIPYLSKKGYPYHLFVEAHPELAKEGLSLTFEEARTHWLRSYLKSAGNCSVKKMSSMFKAFLNEEQIEEELNKMVLAKKVKVEKVGKMRTVVFL